MVWALSTMTATHFYRLYTDYGGYTLDFSGYVLLVVLGSQPLCGHCLCSIDMLLVLRNNSSVYNICRPLMVLVQKVTLVAYALHDGKYGVL